MAMTPQHVQFLTNAHNFFVGHQGAVGALVTDTGEVLLIRSGEHGGPWGGTHRGGFPRGAGWGFTQGGSSQGNIATHVEGHAAAIMWQRKFKSATLLVDRAMCNICSRDLPSALPPGARIVVISRDEGETQVRSSHAEGDDIREVLELRQYQERLLSLVNLYSGEHAAQLKLLTTSFAGFAVNKVFNSKEPDMVIWNNAFGALAAARREINQGNVKEALKALIRARFYYIWALRKYSKWKDGIEIAGQKAQVAIGVTAVVLIVAAAAATVATVAAAGATAGATASTEAATLTAIQQTLAAVAQGERAILAVDELIEVEEVVEQSVRFL